MAQTLVDPWTQQPDYYGAQVRACLCLSPARPGLCVCA